MSIRWCMYINQFFYVLSSDTLIIVMVHVYMYLVLCWWSCDSGLPSQNSDEQLTWMEYWKRRQILWSWFFIVSLIWIIRSTESAWSGISMMCHCIDMWNGWMSSLLNAYPTNFMQGETKNQKENQKENKRKENWVTKICHWHSFDIVQIL